MSQLEHKTNDESKSLPQYLYLTKQASSKSIGDDESSILSGASKEKHGIKSSN